MNPVGILAGVPAVALDCAGGRYLEEPTAGTRTTGELAIPTTTSDVDSSEPEEVSMTTDAIRAEYKRMSHTWQGLPRENKKLAMSRLAELEHAALAAPLNDRDQMLIDNLKRLRVEISQSLGPEPPEGRIEPIST
jgi:hypothetical protein